MKMRAVAIGTVVVVVLGALVAPRFFKEEVVVEAAIPVVEVAYPGVGSIELYRDVVGKVEPADMVYLYPTMAGEVIETFVKVGDMVEAGQSICTIDTKQITAVELALESARLTKENADTTLARQKVLYAAGDISQMAYEQVVLQAQSAQIQYDSAKLNYDNQIEYSNITATIGGKIESFDIQVHDNVSAQTMLAVISGEGSKVITFSVPESVVENLKVGDVVVVQKDQSEYEGTITEISSMISATTGLFQVKATVEDQGVLSTGSSVVLSIMSKKVENVMTLPVKTVYFTGGDASVYAYVDGVLEAIPVEVGIYDEELIEVKSGITSETQVLTTWSSELFEGSKVQLVNEEKTEKVVD